VSGGSTDHDQHKIKVVIIIDLKLDSRVNSGQGLGHESGGLNRVSVRIKVIIIVVLKPELEVNPRQGSGYKSRELTRLTQDFYFLKNQRFFHSYFIPS